VQLAHDVLAAAADHQALRVSFLTLYVLCLVSHCHAVQLHRGNLPNNLLQLGGLTPVAVAATQLLPSTNKR
jgi:hypothetical protein